MVGICGVTVRQGAIPLIPASRDLAIAQRPEWEGSMLRVLRFAAIASLAFGTVVVGASAAGAATGTDHQPVSVCKGTLASPGVLAGTFHGNVVVIGACAVNGGAAVIRGDLILTPGSVLNAMFALDDVTGKGTSSLTVFDDVS